MGAGQPEFKMGILSPTLPPLERREGVETELLIAQAYAGSLHKIPRIQGKWANIHKGRFMGPNSLGTEASALRASPLLQYNITS